MSRYFAQWVLTQHLLMSIVLILKLIEYTQMSNSYARLRPEYSVHTYSFTYSYTHYFWVRAYPMLKVPLTNLIAFSVKLITIKISLPFF